MGGAGWGNSLLPNPSDILMQECQLTGLKYLSRVQAMASNARRIYLVKISLLFNSTVLVTFHEKAFPPFLSSERLGHCDYLA